MTFPTQSQFTSGIHVLGGFPDEHGSYHRDLAAVSPKHPSGSISRLCERDSSTSHPANPQLFSPFPSHPSSPSSPGQQSTTTVPCKSQPSARFLFGPGERRNGHREGLKRFRCNRLRHSFPQRMVYEAWLREENAAYEHNSFSFSLIHPPLDAYLQQNQSLDLRSPSPRRSVDGYRS